MMFKHHHFKVDKTYTGNWGKEVIELAPEVSDILWSEMYSIYWNLVTYLSTLYVILVCVLISLKL